MLILSIFLVSVSMTSKSSFIFSSATLMWFCLSIWQTRVNFLQEATRLTMAIFCSALLWPTSPASRSGLSKSMRSMRWFWQRVICWAMSRRKESSSAWWEAMSSLHLARTVLSSLAMAWRMDSYCCRAEFLSFSSSLLRCSMLATRPTCSFSSSSIFSLTLARSCWSLPLMRSPSLWMVVASWLTWQPWMRHSGQMKASLQVLQTQVMGSSWCQLQVRSRSLSNLPVRSSLGLCAVWAAATSSMSSRQSWSSISVGSRQRLQWIEWLPFLSCLVSRAAQGRQMQWVQLSTMTSSGAVEHMTHFSLLLIRQLSLMLLSIGGEREAIQSEVRVFEKVRYKLSNQLRHFKQFHQLKIVIKLSLAHLRTLEKLEKYDLKQIRLLRVDPYLEASERVRSHILAKGQRLKQMIGDAIFLPFATLAIGFLAKIHFNIDKIEKKLQAIGRIVREVQKKEPKSAE